MKISKTYEVWTGGDDEVRLQLEDLEEKKILAMLEA